MEETQEVMVNAAGRGGPRTVGFHVCERSERADLRTRMPGARAEAGAGCRWAGRSFQCDGNVLKLGCGVVVAQSCEFSKSHEQQVHFMLY